MSTSSTEKKEESIAKNSASLHDHHSNTSEETSQFPVYSDVNLMRREYAHSMLQASLGEFLVLELREAIHAASRTIIDNDHKIEELEEKVRNYEDHIECLEKLVKDLQGMLRSMIESEPKISPGEVYPAKANDDVAAPFVEVPLDDTPSDDCAENKQFTQHQAEKRKHRRLAYGNVNGLIEIKPQASADLVHGTLNDFFA